MLSLLDKFVRKVQPEWKSIDQLARKYEKKFVNAYTNALIVLRESIDVKSLQYREIKDMGNFINYSYLDTEEIYVVTGMIIRDAMKIADEYLPLKVLQHPGYKSFKERHDIKKRANITELGIFNMRNPMAVEWSVKHTGATIVQVTNSTKSAVQQIITTALQQGGHPYETAREIRQLIGLTDNQMKSVANYQEKLLAEGTRSDKAVDARVDSYVNGKIRDRAETIARTETITAACQGQQLHWNQMVQEGLIDKGEMEKVWIATPDDRTCEECAGMDGEVTEIDGVFSSGDCTPTAHTDCRCAIGLQEKELSAKELEDIINEPVEIPAVNVPAQVPTLEMPDEWRVTSEKDKGFEDTVNAQISKLYQTYPEIKTILETVKIFDYKKMVRLKSGKATGATYSRKGSNYHIAIRDYTVKEILKINALGESQKWHPEGTIAAASTVTHEVGHIIHFFLEKKLRARDVGSYAQEINDLFLNPIPDSGLEDSSPEQKMKYGLSEYAMTNTGEMIAEAFSEYFHNSSPRPMAQAVMEVINKYFEMATGNPVKETAKPLENITLPSLLMISPIKPTSGHAKKLEEGEVATQKKIWADNGLSQPPEMYDMINAVNKWSYHGDAAIRGGRDPDSAEFLEKYIAASPSYKGTLYRGIAITEDILSRFEKGKMIDMEGISSFSSSKEVVKEFSQNWKDKVGVVFIVSKIEQSASISHLSQFEYEKEVLVSKDAKFEIINIKKEGETTYVKIKEIVHPNIEKSMNFHGRIITYCKYLQEKYPIGKSIDIRFGDINDQTWAVTNSRNCSILFNSLYFQSEIEVNESIGKAIEIGWHPIITKGLEAESIAAHEYGHILYAQKIKETIFETAILAIWNIYKKNPVYFASDLSIYATKMPPEMFAECFSTSCVGASGTIAKQVMQIIREVYSDAAFKT